MAFKVVSLTKLGRFLTNCKNLFVAKEEGKGLSTNDFTTEEKQKLTNIQAGAQVNVIESVKVNNSPLPISEKGVNVDLTPYALKTDVTGAMKIKGTVDNYAALPKSPAVGDAYGVTQADPAHDIEAGEIVLWNGTDWVDMGGTIDLSAYQTKASLDTDVDALGYLKPADLSGYQTVSGLDTAVSGLGYMKTTAADAKYQTIAGMTAYMRVADYPEATDEEIDALFE